MIRCLIVDDEPIAIRVLNTHLEKIPDVQVVATCTNALDALQALRVHATDLVFLDIEMPELSGIDFVESLASPPDIVFTTAHRDYAVRGFDLDAVDYLLKPVAFPRLLRAVEKYRRKMGSEDMESPMGGIETIEDSINVRVGRRTVRVALEDIIYVESLSDYVIIHAESDRYTTKVRIRDLEKQLAPFGIVRIHRSYLAALPRVDSFTSSEVQLGETVLPVSRSYQREVMARLEESAA